MIAGVIGVLAGGLMLFFAPGQDIRYNGLGQTSLVVRITERGLVGDLKLVGALPGYLWRTVVWISLGVAAWWFGDRAPRISRARMWSAIAMIATAVTAVLTLLLSPKQGPRLYFASSSLVITAIASLVVPQLVQRWSRIVAWVLAGLALAFFTWSCLSVYSEVGPEFFTRFDAIERAQPHAVVNVSPYTKPKSRWFVGEDFGVDQLRFNLAFSRHLQGIVLDSPAEVNIEPTGL